MQTHFEDIVGTTHAMASATAFQGTDLNRELAGLTPAIDLGASGTMYAEASEGGRTAGYMCSLGCVDQEADLSHQASEGSRTSGYMCSLGCIGFQADLSH